MSGRTGVCSGDEPAVAGTDPSAMTSGAHAIRLSAEGQSETGAIRNNPIDVMIMPRTAALSELPFTIGTRSAGSPSASSWLTTSGVPGSDRINALGPIYAGPRQKVADTRTIHHRQVLRGLRLYNTIRASLSFIRRFRARTSSGDPSMDGFTFDNLLRAVTESRRAILVGGLTAATAEWLTRAGSDAKKKGKRKKKKKRPVPPTPCAARCQDGCCTAEFGDCLPPAAQDGALCGIGGALCKPCDPTKECNASTCAGCCTADVACLGYEEMGQTQCGNSGALCQACGEDQVCEDGSCCAPFDSPCGDDVFCCGFVAVCRNGYCCIVNGDSCGQPSDCCDTRDTCINGRCLRMRGESCLIDPPTDPQPICVPPLQCSSGVCADCPPDSGPCGGIACCDSLACCEETDVCCPSGECCGIVCCEVPGCCT